MIPCNAGYYKEEHTDESTTKFSHKAVRNDNPPKNKHGFNPIQFAAGGSDSNGSRECWIKTDTDCEYSCIHGLVEFSFHIF